MKKKTYWEIMAAAQRAEMRYHALLWRAEKVYPFHNPLTHDKALKHHISIAVSYRDLAREDDEQARKERIPADAWPMGVLP